MSKRDLEKLIQAELLPYDERAARAALRGLVRAFLSWRGDQQREVDPAQPQCSTRPASGTSRAIGKTQKQDGETPKSS